MVLIANKVPIEQIRDYAEKQGTLNVFYATIYYMLEYERRMHGLMQKEMRQIATGEPVTRVGWKTKGDPNHFMRHARLTL